MDNYKLNNIEKETVIVFNEAEATVECYTCSKAWMKWLDGFCEKSKDITVKKDVYSKTYTFPKKWVGVRLPRILSPEAKAEMAEIGCVSYEKNIRNKNNEK